MSEMIYVIPIPGDGEMCPNPAAQGGSEQVRLPPEGMWVKRTVYWDRRIKHQDVTHDTTRVWVEPAPDPEPQPEAAPEAAPDAPLEQPSAVVTEPIAEPAVEPTSASEPVSEPAPASEALPLALKSKPSRGDK